MADNTLYISNDGTSLEDMKAADERKNNPQHYIDLLKGSPYIDAAELQRRKQLLEKQGRPQLDLTKALDNANQQEAVLGMLSTRNNNIADLQRKRAMESLLLQAQQGQRTAAGGRSLARGFDELGQQYASSVIAENEANAAARAQANNSILRGAVAARLKQGAMNNQADALVQQYRTQMDKQGLTAEFENQKRLNEITILANKAARAKAEGDMELANKIMNTIASMFMTGAQLGGGS